MNKNYVSNFFKWDKTLNLVFFVLIIFVVQFIAISPWNTKKEMKKK